MRIQRKGTDSESIRRRRPSLLVLLLVLWAIRAWPAQDITPTRDFNAVKAAALDLAKDLGAANILLVFDVDNTLLAMNQDLGSDQWYRWQSGLPKESPAKIADLLAAQGLMFSLSGMHPPQRDLPEIIRDLQNAGFTTLVLTSRGTEFRSATERELSRRYDLRKSALSPPDGYGGAFLPLDPLAPQPAAPDPANAAPAVPVSYQNGVFMTAGQNKGVMLRCLLAKTGRSFKMVLMVDDGDRNLTNVQAALREWAASQKTPLGFRGFLYKAEDGNIGRFEESDKTAVAVQYEKLRAVLLEIFR